MLAAPTRVARIPVLVILASVLAVAGCSLRPVPPAVPPPNGEVPAIMGPYPRGVTVWFDRTGYTLESVVVSQPVLLPGTEPTPTADSMTVEAIFAFTGADTNPAPGGGFFYPDVSVLADGRPLSLGDSLSGQLDSEAPPGVTPKQSLNFHVPRTTRSLVLRVIPSTDPYRTADFRLW
jgi:hypothetical protein